VSWELSSSGVCFINIFITEGGTIGKVRPKTSKNAPMTTMKPPVRERKSRIVKLP
jgi:hypothetical protein